MAKPSTEIKNIILGVLRDGHGDHWGPDALVPAFNGKENITIRVSFHGKTTFTKTGWVIVEHPDLGNWQASWRGSYAVGTPQRLVEIRR